MKTSGFELPPEMKAFAEQSIETARKAFQGYLDAAERALNAADSSAGVAQSSAYDLWRRATDFAQDNVTETFGFLERLTKARSPDEIVTLQTEFAKAQMQRLADQTRAIGDAAANTATKSAQSATRKN